MRNMTGAAGGAQFSRAIVTALHAVNVSHTTTHAPKNPEKIVSLEWNRRLLVFDRKPLFLNNNIDVILLDTNAFASGKVTLEEPATYLACGELKGGIDPAGADEHWKTAQSAFDRIRERFTKQNLPCPALFLSEPLSKLRWPNKFTPAYRMAGLDTRLILPCHSRCLH